MSFIFMPGSIMVDESSTFGMHAHGLLSEAPDWPDTTQWLERIRYWLNHIAQTAVGGVLLRSMQTRPLPSATVVRIVRHPRRVQEAWTDGPIGARHPGNPSEAPTVFITYTPADARPGPVDLSPMRYPGPVLAHELTHALMAINGLNSILTSAGARRPIASWTSAAYPNHNEFCATTVHNMLLSEMNALLSDGYQEGGDTVADDPWIVSTPNPLGTVTTFGVAAATRVDVSNFVNSYRVPLEFLVANLPTVTSRLADLSSVAFNPFAHLRRAAATGTTAASGSRGAARRPGPVDITPP
jgi:hypothetical protein